MPCAARVAVRRTGGRDVPRVVSSGARAENFTPAASSPAAAVDLSGTWSGQYDGAFNGTFTLTWTQSNSKLTGSIKLSTDGTVNLNGVVTGNSIRFGTVGSTAITYSGTVSGDSMSGTYQVGGATGGNWSAAKTS